MKYRFVMFLFFIAIESLLWPSGVVTVPYKILFHILQVKELKNVYTTRVNVQVTTAQQNLDVAQTSLEEIRQKVFFPSIIRSSSKLCQ